MDDFDLFNLDFSANLAVISDNINEFGFNILQLSLFVRGSFEYGSWKPKLT